MKTSVIEVRDMLSVLSVQGVESRIGDVPGVESVTVNYSAGNATVRYDETRLDIADIKSGVRQMEYAATDTPAQSLRHDSYAGRMAPGAPPANPAPAAPKSSVAAPATADTRSTGAAQPDKAAQSSTPKPPAVAPSSAPKPAADAAGGASTTAAHAGHDQ